MSESRSERIGWKTIAAFLIAQFVVLAGVIVTSVTPFVQDRLQQPKIGGTIVTAFYANGKPSGVLAYLVLANERATPNFAIGFTGKAKMKNGTSIPLEAVYLQPEDEEWVTMFGKDQTVHNLGIPRGQASWLVWNLGKPITRDHPLLGFLTFSFPQNVGQINTDDIETISITVFDGFNREHEIKRSKLKDPGMLFRLVQDAKSLSLPPGAIAEGEVDSFPIPALPGQVRGEGTRP